MPAGTRFPATGAAAAHHGFTRGRQRHPLRGPDGAHRDWDGSVHEITNAILPSRLGEDDPEAVRTGQQVYEWEEVSVVDAHPERPLLVEVEAHEPRDEVRRLTLAALESRPEVQL